MSSDIVIDQYCCIWHTMVRLKTPSAKFDRRNCPARRTIERAWTITTSTVDLWLNIQLDLMAARAWSIPHCFKYGGSRRRRHSENPNGLNEREIMTSTPPRHLNQEHTVVITHWLSVVLEFNVRLEFIRSTMPIKKGNPLIQKPRYLSNARSMVSINLIGTECAVSNLASRKKSMKSRTKCTEKQRYPRLSCLIPSPILPFCVCVCVADVQHQRVEQSWKYAVKSGHSCLLCRCNQIAAVACRLFMLLEDTIFCLANIMTALATQ